jgi:hypothetical protein
MKRIEPSRRTLLLDVSAFFCAGTEGAHVSRTSRGRPATVSARASALLLAGLCVALALAVVARSAAGSAPAFGGPKNFKAGRYPFSVAIGDLNGDGKQDMAVANYGATTVSVLLNRGGGRFRAKVDHATGPHPSSVAIGDLNGDRKADLAIANEGTEDKPGATVSVLLNKGDASFEAKRDFQTGPGPRSVAIGDLNGDGKPDLATANELGSTGTASVLLNTGDGTFAPARDYATGAAVYTVAIGDLNDDRKLDLALADGRGVAVLLNSGDGNFPTPHHYDTGSAAISVTLGDLNGDGKPDLAAGNVGADYTVSVLLNRGDGTFGVKRYEAGAGYSVAMGDLNGDRRPDLVATDSLDSPDASCDAGDGTTVFVLVNRGDSRFARLAYDTGCDPVSIAIGDLNGDGKRDIATANNGASSVSVLVNATGRCVVPSLRFRPLSPAKRAVKRANCRIGSIRSAYSRVIPRGRVISTTPRPGTVLPKGGKVNLVVSRGPRR